MQLESQLDVLLSDDEQLEWVDEDIITAVVAAAVILSLHLADCLSDVFNLPGSLPLPA